MYFILEGAICIRYYLMTKGQSSKTNIGIRFDRPNYICDYYICYNKRSEFIYSAEGSTVVKAFTLSKMMLLEEIFPKYPKISMKIKETASRRYNKNIRDVLLK